MNTEPLDWQAPLNQKLVRYEALVQLFEEIQRVDDVATIAQRVATRWKYFANVASWRLVVRNDPAFIIIDGARGEASVSHAATLDDWDARYWASQKPTLLTVAAASCSQPMPPEPTNQARNSPMLIDTPPVQRSSPTAPHVLPPTDGYARTCARSTDAPV